MIHIKAKMSFDDAKKLLDVNNGYTIDTLKKSYRDASKKVHPDIGGSTQDMQKVNEAYEVLKQLIGTDGLSSMDRYKKMSNEYKNLGEKISKDLVSKFTPDSFVKYLDELSGKSFVYKLAQTFPLPNTNNPSHAGFTAEFFTAERDEILSVTFLVYLVDVKYDNSLGGGDSDISYNMSVTTYAYMNNRKQKILASDWKSTNRHSVLTNPEDTFPKARMKKLFSGGGKKIYKKADMLNFMKNKLDAKPYGDYLGFDLPDGTTLMMDRTVFRGRVTWGVYSIWKKSPNGSIKREHSFAKGVYFPETEESALKLLQAKKLINGVDNAETVLHHLFNN